MQTRKLTQTHIHVSGPYELKTGLFFLNYCGGLNEDGLHRLIVSGTI